MPESTALMGLGMPPELAARLGNDPNALTAAGNNSQANAATVVSHISTVTTAGTTNSIKFGVNAPVGTPFWVFNTTATALNVFCPLGANMNGSLNSSLSVAQNKLAVFIQTSKGNWAGIVAA